MSIDLTAAIRYFRFDSSFADLGGPPTGQPIRSGTIGQIGLYDFIPQNVKIYAMQIRRLSTSNFSRMFLALDQGTSVLIPLVRMGEVIPLGGYDRGVRIAIKPQVDVAQTFGTDGMVLEALVALTPDVAALMDGGVDDPWELAEGFDGEGEFTGGAATFPQVLFSSSINNPAVAGRHSAKIQQVIISSNVAGIVQIDRAQNLGPGGVSQVPKRAVGNNGGTQNRFNIQGTAAVGAQPLAPHIARFDCPANQPVIIQNPGWELVVPNPFFSINGDQILFTGPSGMATLKVSASWKEAPVY